MNKRIYIPIAILFVALFVSGCGFQIVTGSGKVATETRDVSNFSSIKLAGIGDVYITQGATVSVRIEAEDNLIPYFETAIQGSTLNIGMKNEYMGVSLHPTKPVKFYVTTPEIDAVTLAGSGNIITSDIQTSDFKISLLGSGNISNDTLTAINVDIHLSGSGDITLGSVSASEVTANIAGSGNIQLDTLTAKKVTSKTAGSGNITIGGKVTEQSSEILGSGDYRASGLKSDTATVKVTGSGNSQVSVTGTLNVTILGSGDVVYSGSPHMNVSIAGSGKVNQSGE
jgi:hypothetical protein